VIPCVKIEEGQKNSEKLSTFFNIVTSSELTGALMRFAARLWLAIFVSSFLSGATAEVEVSLAHGNTAEVETRDQLHRLLKAYDLSGWVWTRKVVIENGAVPHSHPVLTLNTRHLKDDFLLLSTFVHEEYHWYETAHARETSAAIAELKAKYPGLPVGGLDGAGDQESSYLHVIVCYAEWQKMKALVGAERAYKVMEFWAGDHYRAIYRLVLDNEAAVKDVVNRYKLLPEL
jgi:hypothetical protein